MNDEDFAAMSISELKLYLDTLKKETFPKKEKEKSLRSKVIGDIKKMETIGTSPQPAIAVDTARKSMNRRIKTETIEHKDGPAMNVPVEPLPTYHAPVKKRAVAFSAPEPIAKAPALPSRIRKAPASPAIAPATDPVPPTPPPAPPVNKWARYLKPV